MSMYITLAELIKIF